MSNLSFVVYTGDGGTGPYAVPFPYLDPAHVGVKVDGVDAAFTWSGEAALTLDAPAGLGAAIEVRRTTPSAAPLVDFTDGAILTEADLDIAGLQQIYIAQELSDRVSNSVTLGDDGHFTAAGRRIADLAEPSQSSDAASKAYVDGVTGAGQAAAAAASATAAAAAQAQAESAQTAAQAAQTAAEAAAAALPSVPFEAEDLADGAVTQAKLADGAVNEAKLADASVAFAKMQSASDAGVVGAQAAGAFGLIPVASQAEAEAGTETALRAFSPERLAQAVAALAGGGGGLLDVQVFTSSGTYTPHADCAKAVVIITGGGGGGGGGDHSSDNVAGGAAGGTAIYLDESPSSTSVTIGAGGAGASNGTGSTGSNSSYDSVTATGGPGGGKSASGPTGGAPTGGTLNISGGDGIAGGGNAAGGAGAGGASFWGGGASPHQSNHASYGQAFGAGGGAAAASTRYGGAGKSGVCVILEFA